MANVLTDLGEEWVCNRLVGSGTYGTLAGTYVGWGTGTGTAIKGNTSLFTESAEARVSGTSSTVSTGSLAFWQNVATISSTQTQSISNAGCFSTNSAGTMFIKGDFTPIPLVSGDSIQFTFTLSPS